MEERLPEWPAGTGGEVSKAELEAVKHGPAGGDLAGFFPAPRLAVPAASKAELGVLAAAQTCELFHDFTAEPAGALPAKFQTGQAMEKLWIVNGNVNPAGSAAEPQNVGGAFSNAFVGAEQAAAYIKFKLKGNICLLGMRFRVGPSAKPIAEDGGAAVMAIQEQNWVGGVQPNGAAHLVARPGASVFDVLKAGTGAEIVKTVKQELARDGATIYTVILVTDGERALMELPQVRGEEAGPAPLVKNGEGPYGFFEVFAGNAATDCKAEILQVWAESTSRDYSKVAADQAEAIKSAAAYARSAKVNLPQTVGVWWEPLPEEGNKSALAPIGASAAVNEEHLKLNVVGPPSGRMLLTWTAWVITSGAVRLIWSVYDVGAAKELASQNVTSLNGSQGKITVTSQLVIAPGEQKTLVWRQLATVAEKATLKLEAGYGASMTATPL